MGENRLKIRVFEGTGSVWAKISGTGVISTNHSSRCKTGMIGLSCGVRIARNADRCNSQNDSVCLSVSPSVTFRCLSRRMKIWWCSLQDQVGKSF